MWHVIATKSKITEYKLIPSPLLLPKIFMICGTLTNKDPAIIPIPNPLLSNALKHGTEIKKHYLHLAEYWFCCNFVLGNNLSTNFNKQIKLTIKKIEIQKIVIVTLLR